MEISIFSGCTDRPSLPGPVQAERHFFGSDRPQKKFGSGRTVDPGRAQLSSQPAHFLQRLTDTHRISESLKKAESFHRL
jgi:hypothetical protein